jgi:hypothetical protein
MKSKNRYDEGIQIFGCRRDPEYSHKKEKDRLKKEYIRRLRLILSTELSAKNKMQAIGSLVIQVLRNSFGIIKWHQEEIQKLDRKTRKMLTIHGQHHPKADIDRLLCPQKRWRKGTDADRRSLHNRKY